MNLWSWVVAAAVAGSVGAAELTFKPLNKAGIPAPIEYGVPLTEVLDHPLSSLSVASAQGLQDAQNLVYALRFGGMEQVNSLLSKMLAAELEAKRFEQAGVYVAEYANALKLPQLHGPGLRLKERAVQLKPEDMDLMRSLGIAYLNDDQPELAAQVFHLVIQRAPVKGEGDRGTLTFTLSISLMKRGMAALANELFALPEVQAKESVSWQNFIDRYGFGQARVGFEYAESREGPIPQVRVTKVVENTSAAVAGMRVGDRFEKVAGRRIASEADLESAVGAAAAEVPFSIVVRRGGSFETFEVMKSVDAGMAVARKLTADGADLASKGDLAAAAALFDRARQAGPRYAKAWFNTAQIALSQGNAPRALECFLAALALGLDGELATGARQQVDQLTMRLGGNAAYAFPPPIQHRNQLAVSLGQQGEHVKSYLAFLELLRDSPGFGGALLGVAFVEQTLGLRKQARDHLGAFLRAYPQAPNRYLVEQTMRDLNSPVDRIAGGAAPAASPPRPPPGRPSFATPGAGAAGSFPAWGGGAPAAPVGQPAWGAAPQAPPTGQAQWGGAGFAPVGGLPGQPGGGGGSPPGFGSPPAPTPAGASWGQR